MSKLGHALCWSSHYLWTLLQLHFIAMTLRVSIHAQFFLGLWWTVQQNMRSCLYEETGGEKHHSEPNFRTLNVYWISARWTGFSAGVITCLHFQMLAYSHESLLFIFSNLWWMWQVIVERPESVCSCYYQTFRKQIFLLIRCVWTTWWINRHM